MIWPPLLPVAQYSHSPRIQVKSQSYLVSRGVYPFVLALPLAQKEYWDTTRSHANAQNQGEGGRGKGMYWDWTKSVTPILIDLHWLPVKDRIDNNSTVYKALNHFPSKYLSDWLHPHIPSRNLRPSDSGSLSLPRSKLSKTW